MSRSSDQRRSASHAGSWYTDDGRKLSRQLQGWLGEVKTDYKAPIRAIISPHAGYSYSGPAAAWAHKHIPATCQRIFVLGPSHHHYTKGCELTQCTIYNTPVGDLIIDKQVNAELVAAGLSTKMKLSVDEAEHSIEMQLPYIAEVMKGRTFTVVPILVGSLSEAKEAEMGRILAPYLLDEKNFFVISSDFCHWGERFSYQEYESKDGAIWQSIQVLDRAGMTAIESQDPDAFYAYQKRTHNTICGRHPIGVLMQTMKAASTSSTTASNGSTAATKPTFKLEFIHYAQSSKCLKEEDSSVSYASAVVTLVPAPSPAKTSSPTPTAVATAASAPAPASTTSSSSSSSSVSSPSAAPQSTKRLKT